MTDFTIDWFVSTLKYPDSYKSMFNSFSSGYLVRDKVTVHISSRNYALIVEYSLQCKRKSSAVFVSRSYFHVGATAFRKPYLDLYSFK